MIEPHGGSLIQRIVEPNIARRLVGENLPTLSLRPDQVRDVQNIARGVYSPLKGFLRKDDFHSVVERMRLADGTVWPIPIVLDASDVACARIFGSREVLLLNDKSTPVAVLRSPEFYTFDKEDTAQKVFGTTDEAHPGVVALYGMSSTLVGGEIELLDDSEDMFPEYNLASAATRAVIDQNGWETVVGFQTRNVPHRGHEFIQKEALKETDGILIHPVMGEKKDGDFKDEYILATYEMLIDKYYPERKALLSVLPFKMRYAGPREAILHAIIRKNYGCSHFIVGRDHAGVGSYYGPYDAQNIFEEFEPHEIGVTVLKYPEVVYSPSLDQHVFKPDYTSNDAKSFSGTFLRQSIVEKNQPPEWVIYPDIYNLLASSYNPFVDDAYKQKNTDMQKGFVLWMTGFSQSGKTTTADRVFELLKERGVKLERLDGDEFREGLSRDLGFSKEDRDENIRRAAFVARLLSRNGVGVLTSFISPYKGLRDHVRSRVENFIEVFCDCPLEKREERDTKGLYAKARKGEITSFTGISDPYEKPESPEIHLDTYGQGVEECAQKVVGYLQEGGFING